MKNREKQSKNVRNTKEAPIEKLSVRTNVLMGIFLTAGILIHGFLGYLSIRAQSPTFDEPLHLAAGVVYWKTRDYRVNGLHHPPLSSMMAAIPVLFLHPHLPLDSPQWANPQWGRPLFQYGFADWLFYRNTKPIPPEELMALGRCAILFLSCLFLLGLFEASYMLYGPPAAWTAFFIGVFSPSILAHGSLVTTDFLFAAFYFFFFISFGFWERTLAPRWALLSGICLGLSFCSKFSAVAAGPVLVLWLLKRGLRIPFSWKQILLSLAAAAVSILLVYQIVGLPIFMAGLDFTIHRVQEGRSTFLLGKYSDQGWWYYFPIAFLIKSPLPLIAGFAVAVLMILKKKLRVPWFLFLPPAVYFILACHSPLQIGFRYVLPVEPFLYVIVGGAVAALWTLRPAKIFWTVMALWLAAGTWLARPFFLSYFNEAAGGSEKGYYFLTDSNIDWGQGLLALRDYMKAAGVKKYYLSYFGTAQPVAYGMDFSLVAPYGVTRRIDPDADVRGEPRVLIAVSATNFQSTYFDDRNLFSWLKARKPVAFVGGSILVFDITGDAESHRHLAAIFEAMGKTAAAEREKKWAEAIHP